MPVTDCFFDTNILLYAFLDFQDGRKHDIAVELFLTNSGIISTQVVNEFCSNLIKKTNADEKLIEKIIKDLFRKYVIISPSESTLISASNLRARYKFSFWDSLIIASALDANVEILYTEDMQDNLVIDNKLTIINPFLIK